MQFDHRRYSLSPWISLELLDTYSCSSELQEGFFREQNGAIDVRRACSRTGKPRIIKMKKNAVAKAQGSSPSRIIGLEPPNHVTFTKDYKLVLISGDIVSDGNTNRMARQSLLGRGGPIGG